MFLTIKISLKKKCSIFKIYEFFAILYILKYDMEIMIIPINEMRMAHWNKIVEIYNLVHRT